MAEDLVLRSIYLPEIDDTELRQIAFDQHMSKSDIIRAVVRIKLREWRADDTGHLMLQDLAEGLKEIDRQAMVERVQPPVIEESYEEWQKRARPWPPEPFPKRSI